MTFQLPDGIGGHGVHDDVRLLELQAEARMREHEARVAHEASLPSERPAKRPSHLARAFRALTGRS